MADFDFFSPLSNTLSLNTYNQTNSFIGSDSDELGSILSDSLSLTNNSNHKNPSSFTHNLEIFSHEAYYTGLDPVMKYFNKQLFTEFSPDINGYVLIFMKPPELSGITNKNNEYVRDVQKLMTFAAIDCTPPSIQLNTESISSRSGGIPFATEVDIGQQCSITFLDTQDLQIYNFHHVWLQYIQGILEGYIEPAAQFITPGSAQFGALDYAASIYIVRFDPSMKQVRYVSKCIGVFPQSIPSKEVIGSRSQNELTTLPYNYFCTYFIEGTNSQHWVYKELQTNILGLFNENTGSSSRWK